MSTIELDYDVEFILRKLQFEALTELADYLQIEELEWKNEEASTSVNKRALLRKILELLDAIESPTSKIDVYKNMVGVLPDELKDGLSRILSSFLEKQTSESHNQPDAPNPAPSPIAQDESSDGVAMVHADEAMGTNSEATANDAIKRKALESEVAIKVLEADLARKALEAETAKRALAEAEIARHSLETELSKMKASPRDSTLSEHGDCASVTGTMSVKEAEIRTTVDILKKLGIADAGTSAFRRDFKIIEKIDGPVDKRLDYISLCSQISEAKRKGYLESEIVYGVKKAVVPGELRTYLDSKKDMSLEDVMRMIRGSYSERSASEMFQDLHLLSQEEREDAKSFLFRALTLRQRIIDASEAENEIKDTNMIRNAFLHAVRTGLRQESIRAHMSPLLEKNRNTPDAVLISEINIALSEENARQKKLHGMTPAPEKKRIQVNETVANQDAMKPLLDALISMKQELATMSSSFQELKDKPSGSRRRAGFIRKCQECQKINSPTCFHRWKCGADSHKIQECPELKKKN